MISVVHGFGTPGVVAKDDGGCAEERSARKQTQLSQAPIDEGVRDLVHQFREFLIALCFPQEDKVLLSSPSARFL
jgi:hypothetical protein